MFHFSLVAAFGLAATSELVLQAVQSVGALW
jgi:hypothetical protein